MNITFFKQILVLHKWMGLACFIFILVLSVSGILLMHSDSLELEKRMVGGQYLPKKYFSVAGAHRVVQSLAIISKNDTRVIFSGTDHGLFRSGDSGQSWIKLKQGLFSQDIRVLAVNPEDSQVIYAGTPKGIFKSEDQGESWSEWFDEANGLTNTVINDLQIDPRETGTLYAATKGGLYVSHDEGEFWEPTGAGILENLDVRTVRFSAAQPDHLIIGTETGTFRSSDGGQHWEKKWETLPQSISSLIGLNTDPEFIFVGTDKGLFKSFNGGLNWLKDKHPEVKEVRSLSVDSRDQSVIYMVSGKGLFSSKNGGDLWQEITPFKNNIQNTDDVVVTSFHTILPLTGLKNRPAFLLAGSDIGLFISNNNGMLWNYVDLGDNENTMSQKNFKMDLAKLVTEIHSGRFFGSYFYWLVDLSTLGMIALAFSGLMIVLYRKKMQKEKISKKIKHETELDIDVKIKIVESVDDLSIDSQNIHDMVEHINQHLQKCKSIYIISQEKEEIEKIVKHISKLDKKMHHLMDNIDGFTKLAKDIEVDDPSSPETLIIQEHSKAKNTGA